MRGWREREAGLEMGREPGRGPGLQDCSRVGCSVLCSSKGVPDNARATCDGVAMYRLRK